MTETPSSNQIQQVALIDELASIVAKLPRRENIFAGQILKSFDFFGRLTPIQEQKVREIVAEHGDGFSDFWFTNN